MIHRLFLCWGFVELGIDLFFYLRTQKKWKDIFLDLYYYDCNNTKYDACSNEWCAQLFHHTALLLCIVRSIPANKWMSNRLFFSGVANRSEKQRERERERENVLNWSRNSNNKLKNVHRTRTFFGVDNVLLFGHSFTWRFELSAV